MMVMMMLFERHRWKWKRGLYVYETGGGRWVGDSSQSHLPRLLQCAWRGRVWTRCQGNAPQCRLWSRRHSRCQDAQRWRAHTHTHMLESLTCYTVAWQYNVQNVCRGIRTSLKLFSYKLAADFPVRTVGGVAQWLGRRSLAGGHSLIYAWSINMWPLRG